MKIIISGSRIYHNYKTFKYMIIGEIDQIINPLSLIPPQPTTLLFGDARGVDALAKRFAGEEGYDFKEFKAEWGKYGKSAGPIRNKEMAKEGDMLIAVWNGISIGTYDMIKQAVKYSLPIHILPI